MLVEYYIIVAIVAIGEFVLSLSIEEPSNNYLWYNGTKHIKKKFYVLTLLFPVLN